MPEGTQRGWWQASDGRWYPPSAHPDAREDGPAVPQPQPLAAVHHSAPYDPVPPPDPWTPPMQPHGYAGPPQRSAARPPFLVPQPPSQPHTQPHHPSERYPSERRPRAASDPGRDQLADPIPADQHPFAGLGTPPSQQLPPPLYPVPAYESAPLPLLEFGFTTESAPTPADDSTPPWLQPTPRQSAWPWVVIVAAILILVPVIWFGATQFTGNDHPTTVARTEQGDGSHVSGDHSISATGPVPFGSGSVVYADDLTAEGDPGWKAESGLDNAELSHDERGLNVTADEWGVSNLVTPFTGSVDQLQMTLAGSVPDGSGDGDGFGLTCEHPTADGYAAYTFTLVTPSEWTKTRQTQSSANIASDGTSHRGPLFGKTPATLSAVCATLSDDSVRFALAINGEPVWDAVEHVDGLTAGSGWTVRPEVLNSKQSHLVSLTSFEVRNLAG